MISFAFGEHAVYVWTVVAAAALVALWTVVPAAIQRARQLRAAQDAPDGGRAGPGP